MTQRIAIGLVIGVLAFGAGYAARDLRELSREAFPILSEQRFKELLGDECPKPSPATKALLQQMASYVAKWPADREAGSGLQLPDDYSSARWCFLSFGKNSDLRLDERAAVREAGPNRVLVEVYSAIDPALFKSSRPSFVITAVRHGNDTYVFDSQTRQLALFHEGKPGFELL